MYILCDLVFCCTIFVVITGSPLLGQDVAPHRGNIAPVEHFRVVRAPSPNRYNYFQRPGFGGSGFSGPSFGGGSFGRPGLGGQNFGGSFSNSNANSFSSGFQTPFGGFSLSGSNSFGGSANYGRK